MNLSGGGWPKRQRAHLYSPLCPTSRRVASKWTGAALHLCSPGLSQNSLYSFQRRHNWKLPKPQPVHPQSVLPPALPTSCPALVGLLMNKIAGWGTTQFIVCLLIMWKVTHSDLAFAVAPHSLLDTVTSWMLCRYLIDTVWKIFCRLFEYGAGHKMFWRLEPFQRKHSAFQQSGITANIELLDNPQSYLEIFCA